MKFGQARGGVLLALFVALILMGGGCGQADNKGGQAKGKSAQVTEAKRDDKKKDAHDGWWCDEHGVPEEVCGQCNAKLAAEFKKKGDWCKEHDRPESQCFLCQPELKEKFAAQYQAKYGKEPPPMGEEKATKNEEKK